MEPAKCPHCGKPLTAPTPAPGRRRGRLAFLTLVLALVVAGAVGLAVWAHLNRDSDNPLCFTAKSDGATVGLELYTERLKKDEEIAEAKRQAPKLEFEISRDGQKWRKWKQPWNVELRHKGDRAYVRAKSVNPSFGKYDEKDYFDDDLVGTYYSFAIDGEVAASGDVTTLLDRAGRRSLAGFPHAFANLFSDCPGLVAAPELPATVLSNGCYRNMFEGCSALKTAPRLPATKLAEDCYRGMFMNCAALTAAPELPATKLADGCYASMFSDCEALKTAPELPPNWRLGAIPGCLVTATL